MTSKNIIVKSVSNSSSDHSDDHPDRLKEQELLDETMKLIAGYEEGLTARDFKGMADCTCGLEEGEHSKNHKTTKN
ncbi:MAG: hypothetical protein AABW73_04495 [Nanoarchaeota archaeon]